MENQDIQQQLDQLERPDGTYDENQIQVLEGLEAVRKQTGHVYRLDGRARTASSGLRDRG